MSEEARSQTFQLAVAYFGSNSAYNKWQFAQALPKNIDLQLFYGEEDTLWTDLKNAVPTVPLRAAQGSK